MRAPVKTSISADAENTNLASLLRNKRAALGLTLQEIAERAGTCKSYIYDLESGKSEPGLYVAARLSSVLRISARAMFDAAIHTNMPTNPLHAPCASVAHADTQNPVDNPPIHL